MGEGNPGAGARGVGGGGALTSISVVGSKRLGFFWGGFSWGAFIFRCAVIQQYGSVPNESCWRGDKSSDIS